MLLSLLKSVYFWRGTKKNTMKSTAKKMTKKMKRIITWQLRRRWIVNKINTNRSPKMPYVMKAPTELRITITIWTTIITWIAVLKVAALAVLGYYGGPKHIQILQAIRLSYYQLGYKIVECLASAILFVVELIIYISIFVFPTTSMISEKGFYGMFSGVITTALLQPFENIKMALMLPPRELKPIHEANNVFTNTKTSCKYIYNADGVRGFYKGLAAATLKAALGCYIYFSGLRAFQIERMSAAQNFLVSSLSRLISTFLTNPLNIIETRFQLAYFHGYTSIYSAAKDIYSKEGFRGFFIGGLSSCIKEGTFGGFHYMIYEEFKALGYHKLPSGIVSGMIATTLTHPFEIIRARLQTQGISNSQENKQHRISFELRKLRQRGGWAKGLAPRLFKKPIANTLTFLIFEIMQDFQPKS